VPPGARLSAGQLIRYVHQGAFDARMELKNLLVDEGKAAIEAGFAGTHAAEFAGLQATGRAVPVRRTPSFMTFGTIGSARRASIFR